MQGLFKILFLSSVFLTLISFGVKAQLGEPSRDPNPNAYPNGYYKIGYMESGAFVFVERDTFCAKYPTLIKHTNHAFYYTNGNCTPWFPLVQSLSIINIINDNSIAICSFGTNLCDTFVTTVTPQLVTITSDTTLLVCDTLGNCETLYIPPTQFQTDDWHITGNIGITPLNYLGTNDSAALKFKVNAIPSGFIDADVITKGNTAFGHKTLLNNTTGKLSVAVGKGALSGNTTGLENVAVGNMALNANLVGNYNVAIGSNALALANVTAGSGLTNIAIGAYSMTATTSGYSNVSIGSSSMLTNTTGIENAVVGTFGLGGNTTGSQNSVLGRSALSKNTTGSTNVSVGYRNLFQNITGSGNTVIGTNSGDNITSANYNTILGANIAAANTSNNLYIGDGQGNLFITGNAARRITFPTYGSGTHTGTPTYDLQVDASGNIIETATSSGGDNTDSLFAVQDNVAEQERAFDLNGNAFLWYNVPLRTTIDSATSIALFQNDSLQRISASYFVPNIHPNICLTGCTVTPSDTATNSYTYVIAASTGWVNNTFFSTPQTVVTLDPSDLTNDRIDLFVLQSNNTSTDITGTPDNPALDPNYDAATQLVIGRATVGAGTIAPTVTTIAIYKENVGAPAEYNTSVSHASINPNSTSNVWAGSKDVEFTSVTNGRFIFYTWTSTIDFSQVNDLIFRIRSKANWQTRKLVMQWFNGNTPVGVAIPFGEGSYGFSSTNTSTYQLIDIQLSDFGNITGATRLRMMVSAPSGNIGLYLDNILLITETPISTPSGITAVNGINPIVATTVGNTVTISSNMNNVGTGFRILSGNKASIKTLFGSNTIGVDSTSNANGLTLKADTTVLATQHDLTEVGKRFGIEDNTGVQDRLVDMEQFGFILKNSSSLFVSAGDPTASVSNESDFSAEAGYAGLSSTNPVDDNSVFLNVNSEGRATIQHRFSGVQDIPRDITLSVNGNYADSTGNITIPTGSSLDNLGAGYRLLADNATGIKSLKAGTNITLDTLTTGEVAINSAAAGTVKETHTSGATITLNSTTTWLVVNPASLLASLTVTLPATPTDGQLVDISFGGTITASGSAVVTSFTVAPNTGQGMIGDASYGTVETDDHIAYRFDSSTSKWYRN